MGACRLKLDLERVGLELQVLRPNTTNAKDYKDEVGGHRAHSQRLNTDRHEGGPARAVMRRWLTKGKEGTWLSLSPFRASAEGAGLSLVVVGTRRWWTRCAASCW